MMDELVTPSLLALIFAGGWYILRYECLSKVAPLRAVAPVLDLAAPVLLLAAFFHTALSARHPGAAAGKPSIAAPTPTASAPIKSENNNDGLQQPESTPSAQPPETTAAIEVPAARPEPYESLGGAWNVEKGSSRSLLGATALRSSWYTIPIRACPEWSCRIVARVMPLGYTVSGTKEAVSGTNVLGKPVTWISVQTKGTYCSGIYMDQCLSTATEPIVTGWIQQSIP